MVVASRLKGDSYPRGKLDQHDFAPPSTPDNPRHPRDGHARVPTLAVQ